MRIFNQNNSFFGYLTRFRESIVERFIWPYPFEKDGLVRWRAIILTSILIAGLMFGFIALIPAALLIVKKNAWGLAVVDILGFILGFTLLFVHRVRYEIRAAITLLMFYTIGLTVTLSIGPLSGGPAWLFAFAVLAGVLVGNYAAVAAILINAISLSIIGVLISKGIFGNQFPFFSTPQTMISAGVNFIVLNAITAASVSALVKGMFNAFCKKDALAKGLANERAQLIEIKQSLELEIKERKQAEELLQQGEALFSLINDHTSALVSIHDSVGNYMYASPSHEQLGYKPKDLIGDSGFQMIDEEDVELLMEHLEKAKKGVVSKAHLNYRLRDKAGKTHYFRGSFDAVFKSDGSLERIVCVGENITALRRVQAEKVEALALAAETKKLALVGQVAGKMAHDFNNILGAVMGNAELAILDCSDAQTRGALELIYEQTIRGKNLTRNLAAFAKDQEPKQEYFQVNEKIELVLSLLKRDLEGISLVWESNHEGPDILADPGMIEYALINVMQNSIHAASLIEQPEISIRNYFKDGCVHIEVEDNGCGIPEDSLERIYEPAFTLKGSSDVTGSYKFGIKGTGYGMSNVQKYIEQHKGLISIDSEVGKGTKVAISIPVIEKQLSEKEIDEIDNGNLSSDKFILVVEDEQVISDLQCRILTAEPFNHRVDIAVSGQAAIDLFGKHKYDLVSLDYVLQGAMNGMDVYRHIRGIDKNIPVLFISGNIEFLESIKRLKQKDPHLDHLSKPCKNINYIKSLLNLLRTGDLAR